MAFLKKEVTITVTSRISPDKADQLTKDVQDILNNLSPDQVTLLAKAVKDPILKLGAINELRKRISD
jgi:hypothetical protein